MAFPKQKFRELAFQILYSQHFSNEERDREVSFYMQQLKTTRKNVEEAYEYVHKILDILPDIDLEIKKVSTSYEIGRIQSVEKNILRLAVYELLFEKKLPGKIIISEAIRLAKKFSTSESLTFVNALLDQLYKNNSNLAYNAV